ncbi:MAG TPA: transcriptional regulator [Thiotrichaceae bacterium]|nr:transcriptional regulator [Thiotrichaceae bacterium]
MAKSFKQLRDKMSPESIKRAEAKAQQMLAQMPLSELQRARSLSQDNMAETLLMKQASISKMERRTDIYISTLRSYIEAMGGQLDIIARFPAGEVKINHFSELDMG